MRILTLSYEFPPLGGGGSKVAQGLSAEFVKMGHQVDIITMSYRDLPREEVVEGVRVRRIPCIRSKVDVCHPHELASYMVRAAPAALRQGSEQEYDILHCHFILPDGVAALLPSSRLGIPLVVTAHGSDVPGYNPDRFKLLHKLIAPAWRSVVKPGSRLVRSGAGWRWSRHSRMAVLTRSRCSERWNSSRPGRRSRRRWSARSR